MSASLFSVGGCFTLSAEKTIEKTPVPNTVSERRFEHIKSTKSFVCLYAVSGKPYAYETDDGKPGGIEIEMISKAAEKAGLDIEFVRVPHAMLSGAIRNGRGDVAAGLLAIDYIARTGNTAVNPYKPSTVSDGIKDVECAFMIRASDDKWREMLEKAFSKVDMNAIFSSSGARISDASVTISNPETSSVVSVKIEETFSPPKK